MQRLITPPNNSKREQLDSADSVSLLLFVGSGREGRVVGKSVGDWVGLGKKKKPRPRRSCDEAAQATSPASCGDDSDSSVHNIVQQLIYGPLLVVIACSKKNSSPSRKSRRMTKKNQNDDDMFSKESGGP